MFRWLHKRTCKKLSSPSVFVAESGGISCFGIFTADAFSTDIKTTFLIDTGSALSVLPHHYLPSANKHKRTLSAANGSPVYTFGELQLSFTLEGLLNTFIWTFVIANVTRPILGADFLDHFNLLVDCKNKKLISFTTFSDNHLKQSTSEIDVDKVSNNNLENLIQNQYPNLLKSTINVQNQHHIATHVIVTTPCVPVRQRRRELSQKDE